MFRHAERLIVSLPIDLAAILLMATAMMAFHEANADLAFLFSVSAIAISRAWTTMYERLWGHDRAGPKGTADNQEGTLFWRATSYVGFELVLFLAFAWCSAWVLGIGAVHAAITGAVLAAAHTVYREVMKSITEED